MNSVSNKQISVLPSAISVQKSVSSAFVLALLSLILAPLTGGFVSIVLAIIACAKVKKLKKTPLTLSQLKKWKSAKIMGTVGLYLSIAMMILTVVGLVLGTVGSIILIVIGAIVVICLLIGIVISALLSGLSAVTTGLIGVLGTALSAIFPIIATAVGAAVSDVIAEVVYSVIYALLEALLGSSAEMLL